MRLIPFFLVVLLCGCASVGRKIDQSKADQIKKGETTREEVRKLIGSPDQITKDSEGTEIWLYMHSTATAKPESFIPLVGAFAGGVNMSSQIITIQFGDDGKVSRMTSLTSGTELNHGASTAPTDPASLRPVTDGKRSK